MVEPLVTTLEMLGITQNMGEEEVLVRLKRLAHKMVRQEEVPYLGLVVEVQDV